MARLEQIYRTKKKYSGEPGPSTFPEDYIATQQSGDKPDNTDEILELIDRALNEVTARALGRAADIEAA